MIMPVLLSILAGPSSAPAAVIPRVADLPLAHVTRFADAIFVGRVEEVFEVAQPDHRPGGNTGDPLPYLEAIPIAKVSVQRPLKGVEEGETLHYLATGTWTCDISRAVVGERALFMLRESDWPRHLQPAARSELRRRTASAPVFAVAHSGRGRMPLREVEGIEYATYRHNIVLPEDLPTIDGPEERYSLIRSVHLPSIEKKLSKIITEQLPCFSLSHRQPLTPDRGWRFRVWGDGYCHLIIENPKRPQHIESEVPSKKVMELAATLQSACESDLTGSFGLAGPDGPQRIFEARTRDGRVRFELHAISPELVQGREQRLHAAQALQLWAELRSLFDQPGTLDAREGDRACIDAW